jgi:hypothetical protein
LEKYGRGQTAVEENITVMMGVINNHINKFLAQNKPFARAHRLKTNSLAPIAITVVDAEGIQLTKIWESRLAGAADVIRDTIYRLREYLEVTGLKKLIERVAA